MKIANLSHLETVEANVNGGIAPNFILDIRIFKEKVEIDKYLDADADVSDNLAFAEADAVALGDNSVSNALTQTFTDDHSSISTATSASATDDHNW